MDNPAGDWTDNQLGIDIEDVAWRLSDWDVGAVLRESALKRGMALTEFGNWWVGYVNTYSIRVRQLRPVINERRRALRYGYKMLRTAGYPPFKLTVIRRPWCGPTRRYGFCRPGGFVRHS